MSEQLSQYRKLPVIESIAAGFSILKFRPWALTFYLMVTSVISLLPLLLAKNFFIALFTNPEYFAYNITSYDMSMFSLAIFLSMILGIITSLGFYKMVRDAYYQEKSSFGACFSFGTSKIIKEILFHLLFLVLYFVLVIAAVLVVALVVGVLGAISETFALTVLSILCILLFFCVIPAALALSFSFFCSLFTTKSNWQSMRYGFSLIFKHKNMWRSIGFMLLVSLIIWAFYFVAFFVGVLAFQALPFEAAIAFIAILALFLISFISVFSVGAQVAAYEKMSDDHEV